MPAHGHLRLMKHGKPTRAKHGRESSQAGCRVGLIHEHEPPNYRIEGPTGEVTGQLLVIGMPELDVIQSHGRGTRSRCLHRLFRTIDAYYMAGLPDQCRREKGDITNSAAKIEDPHPCQDAGVYKMQLRLTFVKLCLEDETIEFVLCVPQNVLRRLNEGLLGSCFIFDVGLHRCTPRNMARILYHIRLKR